MSRRRRRRRGSGCRRHVRCKPAAHGSEPTLWSHAINAAAAACHQCKSDAPHDAAPLARNSAGPVAAAAGAGATAGCRPRSALSQQQKSSDTTQYQCAPHDVAPLRIRALDGDVLAQRQPQLLLLVRQRKAVALGVVAQLLNIHQRQRLPPEGQAGGRARGGRWVLGGSRGAPEASGRLQAAAALLAAESWRRRRHVARTCLG